MSATVKSGVISGLERDVAKKSIDVAGLILSGKRASDEIGLNTLDVALQGFLDAIPFEVSLKPETFSRFLSLSNPTLSIFNQLVREIPRWELLDQIEETCFLQSSIIEKARPFLDGLWGDEVVLSPLKPPAGWRYLPVEEAVEAYRKLFGSGLKAEAVLRLAKEAKPPWESEGVPVWIKLSTLARLLGISGNPLEDTERGWEAYARILELFIPKVGKAYTKVFPKFSFWNCQEGRPRHNYVRLTPAGRKTWQRLESLTDDDFVIAVAGANTGSFYRGYSVRHSRIKIVLAGNQFPQDCVMVGETIATQPDRLTKKEHLFINCPGTKYAPVIGGWFPCSLRFGWIDGKLYFDKSWPAEICYSFGSASGFLLSP